MGWRDKYKVHPDVFPMMSDEELTALGEDVKANGLKQPIAFWDAAKGTPQFERLLIDGRNRMEAMERVGLNLDDIPSIHSGRLPGKEHKKFIDGDPVTYIISANLRRRHMSAADIADVVVKLAKIEVKKETGSSEPVSEKAAKARKGGRGKKSPIKANALEINAALPNEQQVSEATVKRAIAKAEGRTPKPKPKPTKPEPDAVEPSGAVGETPEPKPNRKELPDDYWEIPDGIESAREHYASEFAKLVESGERDAELMRLRQIEGGG